MPENILVKACKSKIIKHKHPQPIDLPLSLAALTTALVTCLWSQLQMLCSESFIANTASCEKFSQGSSHLTGEVLHGENSIPNLTDAACGRLAVSHWNLFPQAACCESTFVDSGNRSCKSRLTKDKIKRSLKPFNLPRSVLKMAFWFPLRRRSRLRLGSAKEPFPTKNHLVV